MSLAETSALELHGPVEGRAAEVLTPDALDFLTELHRRFDARRRELLQRREIGRAHV